jgi:hypothetical protein
MATRSRIAIEKLDGTVISVYCHNDGYPDGVGKGLLAKFPNGTDRSVVEDFIEKGDRSTLDRSYAEWRGEKCPPNIHASETDFFTGDIEEWGYLYTKEGEWLIKSSSPIDEPAPLDEVLLEHYS